MARLFAAAVVAVDAEDFCCLSMQMMMVVTAMAMFSWPGQQERSLCHPGTLVMKLISAFLFIPCKAMQFMQLQLLFLCEV